MTKPEQTQTLVRLLTELRDEMRQLHGLLHEERHILQARDFSGMEKIAAQKDALVNRIEQLEQARRKICAQYQIAANSEGLNTFLHGVPASIADKVQALWDSISETGTACMEQNRINGIVVAHQQRHTQDALAILRGAVISNEVYSAKGARALHETPHSLGRV